MPSSPRPLKSVFVTVGTTLFDNLIQNVTNPIFLDHLVSSEGYRRLVIQFGKGAVPAVPIAPSLTVKEGYSLSRETAPSYNDSNGKEEELWTGSFIASNGVTLQWEAYRFRPSLAFDMKHASLILSHAGAGSIMEGLTYARSQERRQQEGKFPTRSTKFHNDDDTSSFSRRKRVVVVINDLLMHNHQLELANALGVRGHLFVMKRADMLLQKDTLDQIERFIPTIFGGGDNLAFRQLADNFMGFSTE